MLRTPILAAARDGRVKRLVTAVPVTRSVVERFVAGEDVADAVGATARLAASGLTVSLDHLGEDTVDDAGAAAATQAYLTLLRALAAEGLTDVGEVSVKLSALGRLQDPARALERAGRICAAARDAGTTVTIDAEDHTSIDATLAAVVALRREFPDTGAVLQAYLRRTEADCADLAYAGSRVRLCKGAYAEPASVAFPTRREVDRSYARCLAVLMRGEGYPMVATHDPAMVALAGRLAVALGRRHDSYEHQMLYGVRPNEQRRLAVAGCRVRVYVPYGNEWYGYLMRRIAERPANLTFFLRALGSRS